IAFEPGSLPDLLPLYYRRLFPFGPYGRWLRYGGVPKSYFENREFSFTLRDDIYVRYQSFSNPQELEREIQKTNPYKIDIGAVYSHRPNQHNTVHMGAFQAQEKELVFDIDMTDYDDVRRCCSSADICPKCWTLMTIAIRIIDRALTEDFGIRHRLWVYSGRRGVHCWVCDDGVRKWSSTLRSAVVEYLTLVKGGEDTIKKVTLGDTIHPFISESLSIVEKYFEDYALVGQDILGSRESWDKVLALLPEHILFVYCSGKQVSCVSGVAWGMWTSTAPWECLIGGQWPVSLKSPPPRPNHWFGLSGRVSVPIDLKKVDEFDPFAVPTISRLCHELDTINHDENEAEENEREPEGPRRSRDYKKTSLAPYVRVFEEFLEEMDNFRKGELLRISDSKRDF
uniref:DNA primase n=1 Tax=Sphenodon punctatus TaxID=8508 RepID=A0A8D0GDL6_SPHPU